MSTSKKPRKENGHNCGRSNQPSVEKRDKVLDRTRQHKAFAFLDNSKLLCSTSLEQQHAHGISNFHSFHLVPNFQDASDGFHPCHERHSRENPVTTRAVVPVRCPRCCIVNFNEDAIGFGV